MSASSRASPDFDRASTTSSCPIMPRSPWLASEAWTKKAAVPVEAKVAAILRATWPDLPMPVQAMRPRAANSRSTAAVKSPSRASACRARAEDSVARTRRPTATASKGAVMGRA